MLYNSNPKSTKCKNIVVGFVLHNINLDTILKYSFLKGLLQWSSNYVDYSTKSLRMLFFAQFSLFFDLAAKGWRFRIGRDYTLKSFQYKWLCSLITALPRQALIILDEVQSWLLKIDILYAVLFMCVY